MCFQSSSIFAGHATLPFWVLVGFCWCNFLPTVAWSVLLIVVVWFWSVDPLILWGFYSLGRSVVLVWCGALWKLALLSVKILNGVVLQRIDFGCLIKVLLTPWNKCACIIAKFILIINFNFNFNAFASFWQLYKKPKTSRYMKYAESGSLKITISVVLMWKMWNLIEQSLYIIHLVNSEGQNTHEQSTTQS